MPRTRKWRSLGDHTVGYIRERFADVQVAFSLTPAKLKELWIIPLGFVLITGVSALVAWLLSKVFRLKKSQT